MAIIYHTNLIVIGGLLSVFFDNSERLTDYRDKHTHQSEEYNEDKRHEEYLTKWVSTLKIIVIQQTVIECNFLLMQFSSHLSILFMGFNFISILFHQISPLLSSYTSH